eukprot:scaffold4991_cov156-Ochromonas_danica.AAC.9
MQRTTCANGVVVTCNPSKVELGVQFTLGNYRLSRVGHPFQPENGVAVQRSASLRLTSALSLMALRMPDTLAIIHAADLSP